MGQLSYGSSLSIHLDDRTLAHLQAAIGVKLHNGESFYLSWATDKEGDSGRSSVWIFPSAPLFYTFVDSRWPGLNPKWVEALVRSANTIEGMTVVPEPGLAG
ncbi:DUF7882 family protein [Cryobacterium sp. W22_MBD10_FK3]|uniref:DUF7882 family protein n=1 Tax=Cryobacterium sp. W22_MBD10_FK3 TaxID=3240273 RepID=UPI003F93179A